MGLPDDGAWAEPVADGSVAGPNLELAPEFGALERAAQGKPEQQYGDTIIAAADPDWKDLEEQALELLDRTRDLRVLTHLAVARLHLAGFADFTGMLSSIRELLTAAWQEVHPQLDPEDNNDPTLRANALLRLAHPSFVLRHIRDLPLANSPRLGRFSWRDIALATGVLEAEPDQERPSEAMIRSAFQDSDMTRLAELRAATLVAAEQATAIAAIFDDRTGYGTGPDFQPLTKLLNELIRDIDRYVVFPTTSQDETPAQVSEPMAAMTPAPPQAAQQIHAGGSGEAARFAPVRSRGEVIRLLDLVCEYYERYEPSSPLPMLLQRARGLVDKNFLEILRDLAPDGLTQAQTIVGSRDE
ncbi:MAG: type VI secretion system protein TssA [Acetobacteraceae bacterium]